MYIYIYLILTTLVLYLELRGKVLTQDETWHKPVAFDGTGRSGSHVLEQNPAPTHLAPTTQLLQCWLPLELPLPRRVCCYTATGRTQVLVHFLGLVFFLCFTTSHFFNLLNMLQRASLGNFLIILFTWNLCAFFGYIYEQFNELFLKLIWFCNLYRIQEMIKRAILYSLCKYFNCCSVWQNGI